MRKTIPCLFLVACMLQEADAQDFILPMGSNEPWTGKMLFNSEGGYNTGANHDW